MKKITSFLLVITLTILCGMTAFAAPKTMPDGNKFDPQFYATAYPAVNELAKGDENLLYAHYLNFGKLMGYVPYDDKTVISTANTVKATVKTMADGNKFDAKFYATKYPAVNELAKGDENLLYAHYLSFGKLMGYIPYEGYTDNTAAVVTTPTATVNVAPQQITGNETPAVNVQSSSKADYILNTSTKKFHYPSCSSVDAMSEKNKEYYSGDRDTVINRGFDPCKKCNP